MKFVLQTINGEVDSIEIFNMKKILDGVKRFEGHTYSMAERADIEGLEGYIPVGTIEFVGQHLKKYYGIEKQNPIEVPKPLRTEEFLGRYYKILRKEDLPDRGFSFIKNVSVLKSFAGMMAINETTLEHIKEGIYQISDYTEFISEYRVLVLNGQIQAIQHYREDALVFPDVKAIAYMVKDYKELEGSSKAFTIDVGVDRRGRTLLIEIHTFTSCGTYGYDDSNLIHMYKFGYEYLIHSNREIELDELE